MFDATSPLPIIAFGNCAPLDKAANQLPMGLHVSTDEELTFAECATHKSALIEVPLIGTPPPADALPVPSVSPASSPSDVQELSTLSTTSLSSPSSLSSLPPQTPLAQTPLVALVAAPAVTVCDASEVQSLHDKIAFLSTGTFLLTCVFSVVN